MKVITGRKIIVQDAKSNFTTTGFSNPFTKPSPFGNIGLQSSTNLTNPFINKGTTTGGLTNPWAKAPTSYLQQSIDKQKEEEFKKSAEYAEQQKRIEERKKKIAEEKAIDKKLEETAEEEQDNKLNKTNLLIGGGIFLGVTLLIVALIKN